MYKLSNLAVFKDGKLQGYLTEDESITYNVIKKKKMPKKERLSLVFTVIPFSHGLFTTLKKIPLKADYITKMELSLRQLQQLL